MRTSTRTLGGYLRRPESGAALIPLRLMGLCVASSASVGQAAGHVLPVGEVVTGGQGVRVVGTQDPQQFGE